jgi:hypothetical protein
MARFVAMQDQYNLLKPPNSAGKAAVCPGPGTPP